MMQPLRKGLAPFLLLFCFASAVRAAGPFSAVSGAIWFPGACPEAAQKGRDVCAQDRVGTKSAATYFDVLKQAYPNLKLDGSAADSKKPRVEFGGFSGETGSAGSPLAEGENLFYLKVQDGDSLRVLTLQEGTGLLAYVQVEPMLKLLDLVSIAQDQHVSLNADLGIIPVRAGGFVFLANNWHFNSSEAFNIYNLFLAGPERVSLVYDGPFLYGFALPERPECRLGQRMKPLQVLPTRHEGVSDLLFRVEEERVCQGKNREIVSGRRSFEAKLHWEKGKYMGGSRELHRLNNCRTEGKPGCS
ncbi:MAG: hypothetical protein IT572_08950 [Deltaproteobacteria bacterium]|nr:hypothetical protein [Deltaproteobacteria bacterium]